MDNVMNSIVIVDFKIDLKFMVSPNFIVSYVISNKNLKILFLRLIYYLLIALVFLNAFIVDRTKKIIIKTKNKLDLVMVEKMYL